MPAQRNTYKYHFKVGRKIVYTGVAMNLEQREYEHRLHPGWEKGRIKKVGEVTTRDAAVAWEMHQAAAGKPVRL